MAGAVPGKGGRAQGMAGAGPGERGRPQGMAGAGPGEGLGMGGREAQGEVGGDLTEPSMGRVGKGVT